ncbi:hypothetical protein C1645_826787 [Glomus cerebriforme]|uniref:Uncharacterized protein n=1 Tax=Glomus cerebriforme TaxID=658196 RepID=A0A397SQZ3_9GLOM|nr:hypothetical protein C1645_826787 [Glomus cerebriforme]
MICLSENLTTQRSIQKKATQQENTIELEAELNLTKDDPQEDSNDIVSTSLISAEELLEDFLSNENESQQALSEYILSDNKTCIQQKFASKGSLKSSHVRYQLQEECKALFLRIRNNTTELAEKLYDELTEFITDDTWQQILHLHLKATDLVKLRQDNTIVTNLGAFVHQAVKNILIAQNNNENTQAIIKKYDEYTINLKILTKLGIVKSLLVRELLIC